MKKVLILALLTISVTALLNSDHAHALNLTSPYSWDRGLFATTDTSDASTYGVPVISTHAWGRRATQGAWGTGSVNYQSGSTVIDRMPADWFDGTQWQHTNSVNVVLSAGYCTGIPERCYFGNGTGYKSIVQLWNDPNNYIAFGLIHDPGVARSGVTLMVEGAANGKPVGGYWDWRTANLFQEAYSFDVSWNNNGVTLTLGGWYPNPGDNFWVAGDQYHEIATLGEYPVRMTEPSVSFLGAARNTGDIVDTHIYAVPGYIRGQ